MAKLHSKDNAVRVALLGAETLLGHELDEVLKSRGDATVIGYAATGEGNFGEQEGEAIYLDSLTAEALRQVAAIVLAGLPEGTSKAYELAKEAGGHPIIIDCTGHLHDSPEARIIAPLVKEPEVHASWLLVLAHPAASALALVLTRLARYRPISRSVATIFEPVSERGKRGVSELHQQTTSLLGFKALDKSAFDAQVSFNLLAEWGEEAAGKLSSIEQRIEHDLASILAREPQPSTSALPSLRLLQAPVFHGYSISLWVEFEGNIAAGELCEALASAQIEVRGQNDAAPDTVGVAGQSGLIAGDIRIDRNNPRAAWLWIVGDNLRLTADGAAQIVGLLKNHPTRTE